MLTGLEKDAVRDAALSTLAKGEREARLVRRLFDRHFAPPVPLGRPKIDPARVLADPPRLAPGQFQARWEGLRTCLRRERDRLKAAPPEAGGGSTGCGIPGGRAGPPASPAHRLRDALSRGDRDAMRALASDTVAQVVCKVATVDPDEIIRQVKVTLDWAAQVDQMAGANLRNPENLVEMDIVREMEITIIDEIGRHFPGWATPPDLAGIDFSRLNLQDLADMERLVARLARSLATRPSYRQKRAAKGEIDLRRTARSAWATGGTPLRLCHRTRQPHRPQIAVLCDLSGSVSLFTGFMLQLIHTVQGKFSRVRTFAFVDDVAEITELLKKQDFKEALHQIEQRARIRHTPFSDYGAVWREFARRYLDCLTPQTTVLVLGDARNNWKPSGTEYLEQIRSRAARIVWLNPAPRDTWDREDSIISQYAPYCHRLFECRNLRQLAQVARYIGKL